MSETLIGFLLALLLLCLSFWRSTLSVFTAIATGVCAGAVGLTRAAVIPMLVGIILGAIVQRPVRRSIPIFTVFLLILGTWCFRNWISIGLFAPNSNGALNFYLGNNSDAPLVHSYKAMYNADSPFPDTLPEAKRAHQAAEAAKKDVLSDPIRTLIRMLMRIPDVFEQDRMLFGVGKRGQFPDRSTQELFLLSGLLAAFSLIPMTFGLTSVFRRSGHWFISLGFGAFTALLATQVITIAHPRLTLPGWIALLPAASITLDEFVRTKRGSYVLAFALSFLIIVGMRQVLLQ